MRDYVNVEHKRLSKDFILSNAPQGCTHFALPRVNIVRYYLIVEGVILYWSDNRWLKSDATIDGLIRFGVMPIKSEDIDYSFMY